MLAVSEHEAPEAGGMTEYIQHHLHHLQWKLGDGAFWTLNIDTLFFTFVLAAAFCALFIGIARRAKVENPGKVQSTIEMIVVFVDGLVRETFHGQSRLIAPLAITIFGLVFFMNFLDMLPVDALPSAGHAAGLPFLRIVPTADLNTTLGMALTVFLLIQYFGLKHKGHLGVGADADVTIYTPGADKKAMFELPRFVLKGGEVIVEQGEIRKDAYGSTLHVQPGYDEGLVKDIEEWFEAYYTIQFANYPVDEAYMDHGGTVVPCR